MHLNLKLPYLLSVGKYGIENLLFEEGHTTSLVEYNIVNVF